MTFRFEDLYFGYDPADIHDARNTAMTMAHLTVGVTIFLELWCHETALAHYRKDKAHYIQAVVLNFVNHYVYGVPIYVISVMGFVKNHPAEIAWSQIAMEAVGILLVHSVCYYNVHKCFHSSPGYYKYHRFHHGFNAHVPPMSANAVGFVEYLFAYILPFTVAAILLRPHEQSSLVAVNFVSMCNLIIHTPKLQEWSQRNIPSWWVSTKDHLEHHAKLNVKYAAPTLNVGWVVETLNNGTNKQADDDDGLPHQEIMVAS